jgi:hypothetical protein
MRRSLVKEKTERESLQEKEFFVDRERPFMDRVCLSPLFELVCVLKHTLPVREHP